MKRVLLTLLALIVVVGLFAAAGYAGYRIGYAQGVQGTTNANGNAPRLRTFNDFDRRGMPMDHFGFGRGFMRGFGMRGFPMMGFGFFAPLFWLGPLLILGLIIWFIYWLFTRSSLRQTRQTVVSTPTTTETVTETKKENE